MKIVELYGPSGVGKTTIVESLCKRGRFVSACSLLREYRASNILSKDRIKECSELDKVYEFSIEGINRSSKSLFQKIQATRFLITALHDYYDLKTLSQLSKSKSSKLIVLNDEGLLHKSFSSFSWTARPSYYIDKYFEVVPLPDAIVQLRCDPGEVFRRADQRINKVSTYFDKKRSEIIHLNRKISNAYQRSIPTLKGRLSKLAIVDTNKPLSIVIAEVEGFLNIL